MELSTWYVLLLAAPLVWGQFPAVCNTPDNLNTKECCPNNCGNGQCLNIRNIVERSWNNSDRRVVDILGEGPADANWPTDVRYQWPLLVFNRVCSCNPGWRGYDCSRCDFGYVSNGPTCVKNQLLVRQNFAELDDSKRREYIKVIKAAKNEMDMEWAVVVREPERTDSDQSFELQNVSTYDMFVTLHTLAAREQDIRISGEDDCKNVLGGVSIDFAHQGPAFLTWHRYYLLIVESELRRVAEGMGIMDFTLPYWDWQMDNTTIFHDNFFGTPLYDTSRTDVSGTLFANDWPTVCDLHYREYDWEDCDVVRRLCNVNDDRAQNRRLQRGFRTENDDPFLPDEASIVMALAANDNSDQRGFRKRLEGFVDLCPGNTPPCLDNTKGKHNNLHNAVHIFLGGHMRIVPSASNDPIFFLHHANIDRLFESWIRRFGNGLPNYGMQTGGHPGHNWDDYLVPFFPLKTNADMYKRSSELGFSYDSLHQTSNLPSDNSLMQCPINSTTGEIDPPCERGGYHPDSSNSIYHIQLYLVFFGVVSAAILM